MARAGALAAVVCALAARPADAQDGPGGSAPGATEGPDGGADAEELEEALEVLARGEDPERLEADSEAEEDGDLFEISVTTLVTATGRQPETNLQFEPLDEREPAPLPDTGLLLDDSGWRVEELLQPRDDQLYPSLWVSMYAELEVADWLLFRGLVDTREIRDGDTLEPPVDGIAMSGTSAEAALADGLLVREAAALFAFGAFTFELGRFRSDVADGLVYKDFGTGLRVRADLEKLKIGPMDAELLLTGIGQRVQDIDNNGLLALRLDWNLDAFQSVSFLMAVTEDENGEISEVLRSAYAESLIDEQRKLSSLFLLEEGGGNIAYIGATAHLLTASYATLDARLVLMSGKLHVQVPLETIETEEDALLGRELEVEVAGLAADVLLRYGVSDDVDLTGRMFLLSGDTPPGDVGAEQYRTFIGVGPLWDWSALFFSGGVNQGFYPNRAASAGVNGRGAFGIGPGIEASRGIWEGEARGLLLFSTVDPPEEPLGGGTRAYGVELDFFGRVRATKWLSFGLELDVLLPGKFFPNDEVAYLAIGMVTLSNAQ